MAERRVPPSTSSRFDYAAWARANVSKGDTVIFPELATYCTEHVRLVNAPPHLVRGNGSTLLSKSPPPPPIAGVWKAPFDISTGCDGVQIHDLFTKGPATGGYVSAFEGQHGFAVHGATNTILCRCGSSGIWGDHFYVSGGARNVIICDPKCPTPSGRHGVAVTNAEDVLVYGGEINALRTLFNFEVHENEHVRRFKAEGVKGHWTLRAVTGTGEGEASDIEFKNLKGDGTRKLAMEVYGTGQPGTRTYGPRRDWTFDGFTGCIPVSPTASKTYVKLHYIDGLTVRGLVGAGPLSTTGST